ncbi:hypothetical protein Avbf_15386 [Armadillidium vulgare]|nr:hypothetical protein Avbf_15386 [Armadillidium vulgare]
MTRGSFLIFLSVVVVRSVERICGLWGLLVARHPFLAVIGSLIFVTFLGSGLVRLNLVFRPYDLWVPQKSEFAKVTTWKTKNFPQYYREQIGIWEGDNVLSPSSIKEMLDFHNRVEKIEAQIGNKTIKWKDVCVQIPKYDDKDSQHCYETGLLEIWGYSSQNYKNLSDLSILKDLVNSNTSKVYGNPVDFSFYLGGVSRDKEGNIIRAKTAVHSWLTMINVDSIKSGDYELDIATGEKVDKIGMEWEKALVKLANNWDGKLIINMRAGHTLGYVLHNSIASDALWVGIGWTVLLIYILFTLGKPFTYEQRIIPVCVGLLAIGMSVLSSYGACSLIGIPYGTLTNVLPILLVALGVDDMYVIVTCWDEAEHIDSVEFRAQIAMRKAGMAITVTSLTDILAFLVGTATSLPGLKWFCIYSAVGIAMVYFLQVTLFVAAMVVNEKWNISRRKNGKPLLMKSLLTKM